MAQRQQASEEFTERENNEISAVLNGHLQELDYVRFTHVDLHGIGRGRTVPARHAGRLLSKGYCGNKTLMLQGPRCESTPALRAIQATMRDDDRCRMNIIPDVNSFHILPWAGSGQFSVAEFFCDLYSNDGTPVSFSPRHVAQKQLEALNEMGLEILSSFELEFVLEFRRTGKPIFEGSNLLSNLVMGELEDMFAQIDKYLYASGVDIEMLHPEMGPGQFEITLKPVFGLDGAEKLQQLKQGIKEIAQKHGMEASFMSKPYLQQYGNGAHFNFSVWSKDGSQNVFHDSKLPNNLSKLALHWIGGIIRHSRGLCSLFAPTMNCYRRLQGQGSPKNVAWGVESRNTMIRAKTGDASSTYVEHRLPSGATNPYLVLAAVIAAGVDGIKNKIEPSPNCVESEFALPKTLKEALICLEEDKEIVSALGEEFVTTFCNVKRHVDIALLESSDPTLDDPEAMATERNMYFNM